jgi:hypothetical protein
MFENEVMTSTKGGNFEPAPAGNHLARICSIILLGTIDREVTNDSGKKIIEHKKRIRLGFELIGKKHVFKEENGPEPFVVYIEMTDVMSPKSSLYKLLFAWLGEKYINKDTMATFNLVSLLGKNPGGGVKAMVNVVREKSKDGKEEYSNIKGVAPVPDGIEVPIGEVPPFLFNFNLPFKTEAFKKLGEKTQKKIQSSDEYKKLVSGGAGVPAVTNAPAQEAGKIVAPPAGDDDLPF